jgi:hypothetical protein
MICVVYVFRRICVVYCLKFFISIQVFKNRKLLLNNVFDTGFLNAITYITQNGYKSRFYRYLD